MDRPNHCAVIHHSTDWGWVVQREEQTCQTCDCTGEDEHSRHARRGLTRRSSALRRAGAARAPYDFESARSAGGTLDQDSLLELHLFDHPLNGGNDRLANL
jgi:hypothetical protein